jgi:hypothetical protein
MFSVAIIYTKLKQQIIVSRILNILSICFANYIYYNKFINNKLIKILIDSLFKSKSFIDF